MIKLPKAVNDFMTVFRKNKYQIYIIGGAIRDLLLGKVAKNWDFTTNAIPNEVLKLYPKGFYNNIYGTVSVPIDPLNNIIYEVTTFRKETDYEDKRHPKKIVWAKTIKEDLARRDFTINAIAFNGGGIFDPYQGQKHLKQKVIIAVGDPNKRFSEDGLRLIRAIRFASELGFLIDEKTRLAIKKNSNLITKISWERIRDEFLKILASKNPYEGIIFLRNTRLLKYILPELDLCFAVPQKSPKRHHIYDVGTHLVMTLLNCPSKNPITRLAALIHDIGKVDTFKKDSITGLITFYNHEVVGTKLAEKIAQRFKLSNEQKEKLILLVKYHQFTVSEIQTDKAVRRFIREVGKINLKDILDLRIADRIGSGAKPTSWRLDLFKKRLEIVQKEPFKITDLKINGYDVMKILNIKAGPKVGQVLQNIFKDVVNNKLVNKKQILLNRIKDFSNKRS